MSARTAVSSRPPASAEAVDDAALDRLFRQARSFSRWQDRPVADEVLHQLYNLVRLGPTSANGAPGRFVFVRTAEGKERLVPALDKGNVEQTLGAPVTVIVAYDLAFHDRLPELYPPADARRWFAGQDALIEETARRNGSLQGAYLILAARALGLDTGPISGFDTGAVDRAFFADTSWRTDFIVNLGYGDRASLHPRLPRLDFAEACRLA